MPTQYSSQAAISRLPNSQSGFVALITVLVIGASLLVVTLGLTLTSINTLQSSSAYQLSQSATAFAEGCVQESLLKLQRENTIPSSVSIKGQSCQVSVLAQTGNLWTFQVIATQSGYQKQIEVSANREGQISITSWSIQ